MSDEEFLARWSRRKREAKVAHAVPKLAESRPTDPIEANGPVPSAGTAEPPEFDPSSLPPIESIAAATDVTAFLRDGVPQELRRAALRRAWSADPAIRDFVGLAENAWDFNDPKAMPGFGSLEYSAERLEALVRRVVGGVAQAAEDIPNPRGEAENVGQPVVPEPDPASAMETVASLRAPEQPQTREPRPAALAAPQPATPEKIEREESPVQHRRHGGALPR